MNEKEIQEAIAAGYPKINETNLYKVLNFIKENPDRWNQRCITREESDCGTAMCFAGWAAFFAEYSRERPWLRARKYLGLSIIEAEDLFCTGNTLETLEELVGLFTTRTDYESRFDYGGEHCFCNGFDCDRLNVFNETRVEEILRQQR